MVGRRVPWNVKICASRYDYLTVIYPWVTIIRPTPMRCFPISDPGGRVMKVRLMLTAVLGVLAAAAVAVPAQAATQVNYAALGDSYSAGVGAGGYDLSSGICSRSPRSYAPLWATNHTVSHFTFVACGGATTTDVLNNQPGGPSTPPTPATMTIGGNDAGFANPVTTSNPGPPRFCPWSVAQPT